MAFADTTGLQFQTQFQPNLKSELNFNTANGNVNADQPFFKPTEGIQFNSMNAGGDYNTQMQGFAPSGSFAFHN